MSGPSSPRWWSGRASASLLAAAAAALLLALVGTPERADEQEPPRSARHLAARLPNAAALARAQDAQALSEAATQLRAEERVVEIPQLPPSQRTQQVADLDGLALHLPAAVPQAIGFHEAGSSSARTLRPTGRLLEDRNPTATIAPLEQPAPDYLVLSSRGRAAAPTSALDVAVDDDATIVASVTGVVTDVSGYLLYGSYPDLRIEIVPDDRPDLRVVAIHVRDPAVRVGDRVAAGLTPIAASVRRLPFVSHIDRDTAPERLGHVHLEVLPRSGAAGR